MLDTLCIEVTAQCRLKCVHCSATAGPWRTEQVDTVLLAGCLRELSGLQEIYLSGGEPFMHKELPQLIAAARNRAGSVVLYSSGAVGTDSRPEPVPCQVLEAARDAGLARIDFSVYADRANEHDAVTTVPGSFDATMRTVTRAQALNIPFGFHVVATPLNVARLGKVHWLAESVGAKRFHALALTRQGRAQHMREWTMEEQEVLGAELRDMNERTSQCEVVLSSELRRFAGVLQPTPRDALRPAFIDIRGFIYPGEGTRNSQCRSSVSAYRVGISRALLSLAV